MACIMRREVQIFRGGIASSARTQIGAYSNLNAAAYTLAVTCTQITVRRLSSRDSRASSSRASACTAPVRAVLGVDLDPCDKINACGCHAMPMAATLCLPSRGLKQTCADMEPQHV